MKLLRLILALMICAGVSLAHDDHDHDDADETAPSASVAGQFTYHADARPLIEASCVGCHSDGQIAAFAPLTEADFVADVADDIAWHVVNRYMPPWMPSDLTVPLKRDRRLSQEEIAIIAAWAEQGAALGDTADYQPPAELYSQVAVRNDLTMQLDEPYRPDADLLDDYRCFGFELEIDSPHYITAYQFIPEVMEMAHHGLVYLIRSGSADAFSGLDGADGKPGWQCYGSSGLGRGAELIATWAPGSFGTRLPAGTGHRIEPGDSVVVQMHYNLSSTNAPDRTRVVFELEGGDADLTRLLALPISAPVEIPCPAGVEGDQCSRQSALQRLAKLYGAQSSYHPDALLRRCDQTLEDYAANTGEEAHGFCDTQATFSATVYGILGHMHELGKRFRMTLNPDSDNPVILLDIPRWNFHWQEHYEFATPLTARPGDTLRMECVWDNTLSDNPRYVVWGEGTSDEMCFATLLAAMS